MAGAGDVNYLHEQPSQGRASLFEVQIKKGATVYRYDVSIETAHRNLVRQTDKTCQAVERRACYELIRELCRQTKGFHSNVARYVYDGRATLYTPQPLKQTANSPKPQLKGIDNERKEGRGRERVVALRAKIDAKDQGEHAREFLRADTVKVEISRNEASPLLDYSDLETGLASQENGFSTDRSVRNFLELVTTQPLVDFYSYTLSAAGTLFEQTPEKIQPGMIMLDGLRKGIRIANENTCHLVADMHRSAFYSSMKPDRTLGTLHDVHRLNNNLRWWNSHFRGVRMQLVHDPSRTFIMSRVSNFPVSHESYNIEYTQSVPDYYYTKYGHALTDSNQLGVHPDRPANRIFPMEMVQVLPGTQIPQERAPADLENSVSPTQRYKFIIKHILRLATGQGAEFLKEFGIKIVIDANDVLIYSRPLPRIRIGRDVQINVQANGSFFRDCVQHPFISPSNHLAPAPGSRTGQWFVAYNADIEAQKIHNYVSAFMDCAQKAGMNIGQPRMIGASHHTNFTSLFEAARNQNIDFILYLDMKREPSHALLKLYEAYYKILTQQVAFINLAHDYQSKLKPQTLRNVLMKTNVKNQGINYVPVFNDDVADYNLARNRDLLIIGMDVAHPTRASGRDMKDLRNAETEGLTSKNPSVVGIVANKEQCAWSFTGDFFYQESLQERVSASRLARAIKNIVIYAYNERKTVPRRVIVIRDGISEGQYDMAVNNEIPAIERGLKEGIEALRNEVTSETSKPKMTFIVATKRHHKRFFRHNIGQDGEEVVSNTRPGDVIRDKYVRSDVLREFFMQAHNPIKGMPKMVQYTVLLNELEMHAATLETFLHLLCNMHQVSGCPTALPLPVYMADETAARGYAIHNELERQRRQRQHPAFVNEFTRDRNEMYDNEELTEWLGYTGSRLAGTRFNA